MSEPRVGRACVGVMLATALMLCSAGAAGAATSPVSKPGRPVKGTGVGTKAALDGPNCDAAGGTVKFDRPDTRSVPCVAPFKKGANNGGTTAPGVTRDSIKVVVYGPSVDQLQPGDQAYRPQNLATGETGTIPDMYHDMAAVFEHAVETYGRKVDFQFVYQTGRDEAAQRADAVTVAALKPFAVLGGASVFAQALAARKILVISYGTNSVMETQQPYRESSATDLNVPMVALAELITKSLKTQPAQWAGDPSRQKKPRTYGLVYSTGVGAVDVKLFLKLLSRAGIKPAVSLSFATPVSTDNTQITAQAQEQAPTMMSKLKDAGVTTVIPLVTQYQVTQELTKAATSQDYSPEWLVTGTSYDDADLVGRMMDQQQWAHAFGVAANVPSSAKAATDASGKPVDSTASLMTWYYGPNKGTYNILPLGQLWPLFSGIQMAGPYLTAANVRQGIFAIPATGGALQGQVLAQVYAPGRQLKLPFPQYATGGDFTLIFWDPSVSGTSNIVAVEGKGMYRRLDGAKRYLPGQLPTGLPRFFDDSGTVTEFTTIPPSDAPKPNYPCDGCPSSASP